ncbi:LPXTG cell wall anchor domain-containing protein [Corynebacterium meridianum]|uniref:LPXTG cell wall anchor domain-containing protein n=1 Tax=Corynebacterium meridianum TaxID=2765363 RepID=UPI003CFE7DB9
MRSSTVSRPVLYRVREKAPADASRRCLVSALFLVTLPGGGDGRIWSYDVVISPKPLPETPEVPGSSDGVIPVPVPVPVPIPFPGQPTSETPGTTEPSPEPESPATTQRNGIAKYLPETGANVRGVSVVGVLLVLLGVFLFGRRRSR